MFVSPASDRGYVSSSLLSSFCITVFFFNNSVFRCVSPPTPSSPPPLCPLCFRCSIGRRSGVNIDEYVDSVQYIHTYYIHTHTVYAAEENGCCRAQPTISTRITVFHRETNAEQSDQGSEPCTTRPAAVSAYHLNAQFHTRGMTR